MAANTLREVPNEKTLAAIAEFEDFKKNPDAYKRYSSFSELLDEVNAPVVVYPKDKLLKIAKIIKDSDKEIAMQQGFDTVEDTFADMGIDVDNV